MATPNWKKLAKKTKTKLCHKMLVGCTFDDIPTTPRKMHSKWGWDNFSKFKDNNNLNITLKIYLFRICDVILWSSGWIIVHPLIFFFPNSLQSRHKSILNLTIHTSFVSNQSKSVFKNNFCFSVWKLYFF